MPQMTPAQARVIDPILSSIARGFKQQEFIGGVLFPTVPVGQRGGKILSFGIEDFLAYDVDRAPGANTKRIDLGYGSTSYVLAQYALEGKVPFELMEEANAVPGLNLATMAINKVRRIMALRLERAQATLALTAGNYGSNNKTTLSGTSQWSDFSGTSDPIADVETGRLAIRAATGMYPNVAVLGAAVLPKLRQHPKIIDRIKYTGRDIPTPELLASLWGIERVVIGTGIYSSSESTMTPVDIWGKHVVLAYTTPGSMADQGTPSFGYTYQLGGFPVSEVPYQDRNAKSWIYPVTDEVAPVIAGAGAGYLITNAVA